jgi:ABC-type polysaccharide/polyol phosphate export permease
MVTLALAHQFSTRRVGAVLERNAKATRVGPSYWVLLLSGIVEPLLYLLSIGVGVGTLIHRQVYFHGHPVSFAAFVAPGMLAFSALGGAFTESIFNFLGKLRYAGVLGNAFTAAVRPVELALGEVVTATVSSAVFSTLFLVVMLALGLTTVPWALLAFIATVLIGVSFSAIGLAVGSLLRGWQDIDLVITGQVALFLLSGTFSPVANYPLAAQVVVQATPLYHAVELVRALTVGVPHPGLIWHIAYLVAVVPVCLYVAVRRMEGALRR